MEAVAIVTLTVVVCSCLASLVAMVALVVLMIGLLLSAGAEDEE